MRLVNNYSHIKKVVLTWIALTISASILLQLNIDRNYVIILCLGIFTIYYTLFEQVELVSSSDPVTLYIGDLGRNISEAKVKSVLERHCPVVSVKIMRDRKTGKSKGYGFVEVVSDSPDELIESLNNVTIEERKLNFSIRTLKFDT